MGSVTDLGNLDNLDTVSQQISQAKTETAAANEIAHGTLWNIASKAPVYGDDITTVQGMTSVVDSLVSDSVPQFMNVLSTLKSAQLSSGDGQLNLQPILEAQKNIATANQSLQQQVQKYQQLPKAHIGMVKNAYATGNTQLTKMADKVNQLSGTFQILPDFLGSDQPRTYALMAMTTSEERSSGGLIGSVGVVTTDNGKIGIGDFRSNGEYIPYGAGDPTEDEQRIFRQWGPLNMSFDVRDLAVYPDTSRSAEGMRAIWQRTPWGSNTQLDGVLMVDPVFCRNLRKSVVMSLFLMERCLREITLLSFLLNKVYVDYPVSMQDALFAQVAEQAVGSMFSNIDLAKLTKVAQLMGSMAEGRHFSMYAFDETAEKTISDAGFTAQTPSSEEHPQVGVYVTEQNPSKMGWYIHRTSKVTRSTCGNDGSQTYHVEYKMTNTLENSQIGALTSYILGSGGQGVEKTLIYAPAGGSISNLKISGGSVTESRQETLNGKPCMRAMPR